MYVGAEFCTWEQKIGYVGEERKDVSEEYWTWDPKAGAWAQKV